MSFLYVVSNITIPILVLGYRSLLQRKQHGTIGYGQCFLMVIFSFVSNFLYLFFSQSLFYLLFDFSSKMGIAFLPFSFNVELEKRISYMHFEILLEKIRSHLIQKFYILHSHIIEWILSKMDQVETKQFKNAVINQLQKKQSSPKTLQNPSTSFASQLQKNYKHYECRGTTCRIVTLEMLKNAQNQRDKQKQKLTRYLSEQKAERDQSSISPQPLELPHSSQINMKKKPSFMLKKSSTELDDSSEGRPSQISLNLPDRKSKQMRKIPKEKQSSEDTTPKGQKIFQTEQSQILNKLDVSQYSDILQEEDFGIPEESKKLVKKVQAIMQIGNRLQIYYIELYSNDEIRIVSLYGREFQRHKLVQIEKVKHGYYELKLEGGKIDKRKVKFRGNLDAFKKYFKNS